MDDVKRHDPLPVIGQAKAPQIRVTSAATPVAGDEPESPTGGEKHIELSVIHDFAGKLHQEHVLPRLKDYVRWQVRLRAAQARADVTEAELIELAKIPDWAPVSINLDLTTSCNFACDHCVDMAILNTGIKFETDHLLQSLELMAKKGARFVDVVKLLKDHDVQVSVVSNGSGNRKLAKIAPMLRVGDWIRLSLDSGTDETFQAMHKPRKTITLDEICEGVPAIREAGTEAFKIGFSYIITWRGATIHDNEIVPNIDEIVIAAERAKKYGFDYIACKPFLTRAERNNAEIVDLSEVDQHFDEITARIRAAIDEARKLEDETFRIYETTNLKVLENRSHGDFSTQPHQCHLQFFRQVLSPLGMYNCPVYRNQAHGRLGTKDAYATTAGYESTRMSTAELIRGGAGGADDGGAGLLSLGVRFPPDVLQHVPGAADLRPADQPNLPAQALHQRDFRDVRKFVIRALRVNVGPKQPEQPLRRVVVERNHVVHVLERREDLVAVLVGVLRLAIRLDPLHRRVRVHHQDEDVALGLRVGEITNVTDVDQFKAAVRRDDHRAALPQVVQVRGQRRRVAKDLVAHAVLPGRDSIRATSPP